MGEFGDGPRGGRQTSCQCLSEHQVPSSSASSLVQTASTANWRQRGGARWRRGARPEQDKKGWEAQPGKVRPWSGQDAGCFKRPTRLEFALCTIAGGSRARPPKELSVGWCGGRRCNFAAGVRIVLLVCFGHRLTGHDVGASDAVEWHCSRWSSRLLGATPTVKSEAVSARQASSNNAWPIFVEEDSGYLWETCFAALRGA